MYNGGSASSWDAIAGLPIEIDAGRQKNSNVRKGDAAGKSPQSGPTAKAMKNQQRIGLLVVYLLSVLAVTAMAATPAGTQIKATGTAQYYSTSGSLMPPGSSNMVTTTVMQVASVSLTPTVDTKEGSSSSPVDFALVVKNTGNGSDTFDFSASARNGSTVTFYRDTNGDGVVNLFDAGALIVAWDATQSSSNWNMKVDINHDGAINIFDAIGLSIHWGQTA